MKAHEAIYAMRVTERAEFTSNQGKMKEFVAFPCHLTSCFEGVEAREVVDLSDCETWLHEHYNACVRHHGYAQFQVSEIMFWLRDQTPWSGTIRQSKHASVTRKMIDEGCIYLG